MRLIERQKLFMRLLPRLLDYCHAAGYEVTGSELWRTPEMAAWYARRGLGIENSLHCDRLAIDLNFFRNGRWIKDGSQLEDVGRFWESLHPLCRWGGRFGDGNHFSITYRGRK
jgi:hypothetical protein